MYTRGLCLPVRLATLVVIHVFCTRIVCCSVQVHYNFLKFVRYFLSSIIQRKINVIMSIFQKKNFIVLHTKLYRCYSLSIRQNSKFKITPCYKTKMSLRELFYLLSVCISLSAWLWTALCCVVSRIPIPTLTNSHNFSPSAIKVV